MTHTIKLELKNDLNDSNLIFVLKSKDIKSKDVKCTNIVFVIW